ncbi:unnamed protein product [Phytomonas sp. EM1]|nr:unnamed protein product [Phytomonas sp. EM1]|eukprot:CCW65055.1 unnamed protein product [Phytomonas sp. isolate EM1]
MSTAQGVPVVVRFSGNNRPASPNTNVAMPIENINNNLSAHTQSNTSSKSQHELLLEKHTLPRGLQIFMTVLLLLNLVFSVALISICAVEVSEYKARTRKDSDQSDAFRFNVHLYLYSIAELCLSVVLVGVLIYYTMCESHFLVETGRNHIFAHCLRLVCFLLFLFSLYTIIIQFSNFSVVNVKFFWPRNIFSCTRSILIGIYFIISVMLLCIV